MNFEIETNEWCNGCTMMEAEEAIIYVDNRPVVKQRYCKYLYVCKNAVELAKSVHVQTEKT